MKPASARRISSHDGPVARARGHPATSAPWAYIFGAICPAKGKHALVRHRPWRRSRVPPSIPAPRRCWSIRPVGTSPKLAIDNITVLALPPRSPDEPGGECLAHARQLVVIFKSYEDIVALCCQAWNNLSTMEDHVPSACANGRMGAMTVGIICHRRSHRGLSERLSRQAKPWRGG